MERIRAGRLIHRVAPSPLGGVIVIVGALTGASISKYDASATAFDAPSASPLQVLVGQDNDGPAPAELKPANQPAASPALPSTAPTPSPYAQMPPCPANALDHGAPSSSTRAPFDGPVADCIVQPLFSVKDGPPSEPWSQVGASPTAVP